MASEHQRSDETVSNAAVSHAPVSYSSYLDIDGLLSRQRPLTDVPDEYLFIVTHQALELWFSEALHEIDQLVRDLNADRLAAAGRKAGRLRKIIDLCSAHMDVLDTMPMQEFFAFRDALGRASGLQSAQFRALELASGLSAEDTLRIARAVGSADARLRKAQLMPSIRQAFGHFLARAGITVHQLYSVHDESVTEIRAFAEELIEYDIAFNRWRYRHYLLVVHAIGANPGTSGSTGARYLRDTTKKWFFPEIWSARSMGDTTLPAAVPLTAPLDGSVSADRSLLGGKGWGLQQMHQLGIPVPPAFTITTTACNQYFEQGSELSEELWDHVLGEIELLERRTGSRFGGTPPLLVSVRSGAPVSMPGMMDTLLNVGLTPAALAWLGDERQATGLRDSLAEYAAQERATTLSAAGSLPSREHVLRELRSSITRVFDSWHSDRARTYRAANHIPDDLGTAVTVQAMVFGNLDERSGTGVYVTRNPITGEQVPFGEWLPQAQGEELVGGRSTPKPLDELRTAMPEIYEQLIGFGQRLERTQRNVLEIEFTVESGMLYLLQVRNSSSTPAAAARWAVDLVHSGVIEIPEALARVPVDAVPEARRSESRDETAALLASGIGVSPGVSTGLVVAGADQAEEMAERGQKVLLASSTTSTHDIHGFLIADGVITERGGTTSHAAVVARQLGLPCVVGCGEGTVARLRGQVVTLDGGTGRIYAGDALGSGQDESEGDGSGRPAPAELLARWRAEVAQGKHN
ncbi:pyruvate, phosphate dikinase [Streptomyces sp. NPDC048434]|uniref:pyruvate, phosphate dikinase n=1 Tax=Streptomyces sp. NPDC048434 TaxID=3365549 RepID=UPI00371E1D4E